MTARKKGKGPRTHEKGASGTGPPAAGKDTRPAPKTPPQLAERPDTGQPGSGRGRVDVTGTVPEGIRVDPDITEGHPGYQESGESEIIPDERLGGEQTDEGKESRS